MSEARIAIGNLGDGKLSITRSSDDGAARSAISLADPDIIRDPYSIYRELRAVSSIFRSDSLFGDAWVFMDPEDILTLLRDTDHLSSAKSRGIVDALPLEQRDQFKGLIELHSRWLNFFDPPKHTRMRKLVGRGFGAQIGERLLQAIRDLVAEMISSFENKDHVDIINDYARRVPLATVSEFLGIPKKDLPSFGRWIGDIATYMGSDQPDLETIKTAHRSLVEFEQYFREVVAERRKSPIPDDLISTLIEAEETGDVLTEDELFAQCTFLSFTGSETTKNLIGNAIYTLLQNDSQRRLLVENPTMIGRAIEEILRFECPVQFIVRIVKEPFTYKSAKLGSGEYVIMMIGAANRDPKVFTDPDVFDFAQERPKHISFGEGIHACLGQGLARKESEIAIGAFMAKFPNAELDQERGFSWRKNPGLRGLESLYVKLGRQYT